MIQMIADEEWEGAAAPIEHNSSSRRGGKQNGGNRRPRGGCRCLSHGKNREVGANSQLRYTATTDRTLIGLVLFFTD